MVLTMDHTLGEVEASGGEVRIPNLLRVSTHKPPWTPLLVILVGDAERIYSFSSPKVTFLMFLLIVPMKFNQVFPFYN